jgi:hypothetical protein
MNSRLHFVLLSRANFTAAKRATFRWIRTEADATNQEPEMMTDVVSEAQGMVRTCRFLLVLAALGCTVHPSAAGLSQQSIALQQSREITPLSEGFTGTWTITADCKMPAPMRPLRETIAFRRSGTDGLVEYRWGNSAWASFNQGNDVTARDSDGVLYRTRTEVEAFASRRTLVVASTWKMVDAAEKAKNGPNLSVILTSYELMTGGAALVFKKFGYSSNEEHGKFYTVPYSDIVPGDYRCVFQRASQE